MIRPKKSIVTTSWRILRETARSFLDNSDFEISAALATYGFFAFLPFLFFLGYLFGNYDLFSQKVIQGIDRMIAHMFPRTDRLITRDLYFFTSHKLIWALAGLGLVLVSVMSLTGTLRTHFGRIFREVPELPFLRDQLQNLRTALIMVLFLFGLILGEILYFQATRARYPPGFFLGEMVPVMAGAFLAMLVIFRVFPPRRLSREQLLTATILSAILIFFMREIFSLFIRATPGFGESFGSLKTLFIMMLWVYYCFLVIIFGAEVMVVIGRKEALFLKDLFLKGPEFSRTEGGLIGKFIREYAKGEVVFYRGDRGDRMFYILSGSVAISGEAGHIRTMGPGEYFGEMSMLLDTPRTATGTAAEPATRLVGISRRNFGIILQDNPQIVLAILKEMTRRLKESNLTTNGRRLTGP